MKMIISLNHYQTTNFRLFQTERVCNDNFKFDKNGRKLSIRVENTGKRRNCLLRAISPFPNCFQKACFPGASKGVIVLEWVNLYNLLPTSFPPFSHDSFESSSLWLTVIASQILQFQTSYSPKNAQSLFPDSNHFPKKLTMF